MTLRTRLILVVFTSLAILAGTLVGTHSSSMAQSEQRFLETSLDSAETLWKQILVYQVSQMQSEIASLTRDRDSIKALRAADYDALRESVFPTYNRLSTSGSISALQVTDKLGQVVFGTEKQNVTESLIAKAAAEQGKVLSSIESAGNGELQLKLAFPLYHRAKLVGVGVFTRTFNDALNQLKEADNSEASISGASGAEQYSTVPGLLESMGYTGKSESKAVSVVERQGMLYTMSTIPLISLSGEVLGALIKVKDYTESYGRQSETNTRGYLIAGAVAALIALFMGLYLHFCFKPLFRVVKVLRQIADGDMDAELRSSGNDEIGQLVKETMRMKSALQQKFQNSVDSIQSSVTQLVSATQRMTDVNKSSASGVEEQNRNTAAVIVGMETMFDSVQHITANTRHMEIAAQAANQRAESGATTISEAINSINKVADDVGHATTVIQSLESESSQISSVVRVIRDIAEQTNLLALNAAIEAARAGEQGRGFAVVADEVRALATRTQSSTDEIEQMVEKLQSRSSVAAKVMTEGKANAEATVVQVSNSGEAFTSISDSVSTINQMISEVVVSADGQSEVTEKIKVNLDSIQTVSQRVSQGTEQAAIAGEDLVQLTADLQNVTQTFEN